MRLSDDTKAALTLSTMALILILCGFGISNFISFASANWSPSLTSTLVWAGVIIYIATLAFTAVLLDSAEFTTPFRVKNKVKAEKIWTKYQDEKNVINVENRIENSNGKN